VGLIWGGLNIADGWMSKKKASRLLLRDTGYLEVGALKKRIKSGVQSNHVDRLYISDMCVPETYKFERFFCSRNYLKF
jgi:hypothetical protein